jgi:predicted RNA-binding Zn-ribbon protein involved in translation (DUF1610 family)
MVPDPPPKTFGVCPECKKGKLVLIRVEDVPRLPKDYVYKCDNCGYQVIETEKH